MMWFGFIISLLILIIPLAYLLASLAGLSYLWYRVIRGKSGGDLPTCGRCGYAVRGLIGLKCPECGADLREVGITTPKQRGAVLPVVFVLMWTLLLPGPSCLLTGILSVVGPKTNVPNHMLTLTPNTSGQYISIEINNMAMYSLVGAGDTNLTIEGTNSQYEYMDIDPVAMTYDDWAMLSHSTTTSGTMTTSSTTAGMSSGNTKPLDQQALLDLFNNAGADITRQHVIDEADELLAIIRGIPTQGLTSLNPTLFSQQYNNFSYDQPAVWFILVLVAIWFVVWVWGLWFFFRIRRRQLPAAHHGRRDPARFAPPSPPPPSAPTF